VRNRARGSLDAFLRRSPVHNAFSWRASRKLAVLAYHAIEDPERFEEHADLIRRDMAALSQEEAVDAILGVRRGLPRRAVLITFDDGHRSVLDVAMPILRERGLPAIAFVVPGLLDTTRMLWTAEVALLAAGRGGHATAGEGGRFVRGLKRVPDEERVSAIEQLRSREGVEPQSTIQLRREDLPVLESAGIAVGNHTLTHPCLSRCTNAKIWHELQESHDVITTAIGHHPTTFAYPDGDCDERVRWIVEAIGYEAAFLFDHRLSRTPAPDRLAVSRIRVNSRASTDRFQILVNGLHSAAHRLRGER
jgi:peptidoglycan/xylan/chitin deacetylase (PgdA/CDA1 family)